MLRKLSKLHEKTEEVDIIVFYISLVSCLSWRMFDGGCRSTLIY